jgi:exodeoxyribonuclease-3
MPETTATVRWTILSYNVLEGFQQSKVQQDVFVEWVQGLDPDIIFYQELNHFTEADLATLAQRYGHPYAVKIHGDGYLPGLSSKYPLTATQRVSQDMTLGYIYAQIAEFHVFALHLNPFQETDRLREVEKLLAHARSLPADAKIIFMGDFNSLAAADRAQYESADFAAGMKLAARPDWTLAFQVTDALQQAGYSDAYRLLNDDFKRSWPTRKRIIAMGEGSRIDYAFLSANLRAECLHADIAQDNITDFLSDHYPLVLQLKREPS